jgi:hypothetical protein
MINVQSVQECAGEGRRLKTSSRLVVIEGNEIKKRALKKNDK